MITEVSVKMNEGIHAEGAQSCLFCGTRGKSLAQDLRDRLFDAPGNWNLLRCPKCELNWLNPRPIQAELPKIYRGYHTHAGGDGVPNLHGVREFIRRIVLVPHLGYTAFPTNFLERLLGRALARVGPVREAVELSAMGLEGPPAGKLLDVGCGNGRLLALMQELGWEAVGVEPDEEAVKVARVQFGLSVFHGTLEQVHFPGASFDAVTMHHVIEHVSDPFRLLGECRRILRVGGRLAIVTPNGESLGRRFFGSDWRGWEVPRHFFVFSAKALGQLTERAGFRLTKLRTTARTSRWMWAASLLIRRDGALPGGSPTSQSLWLRAGGLAFQAIEECLCRVGDFGEELVLIARK